MDGGFHPSLGPSDPRVATNRSTRVVSQSEHWTHRTVVTQTKHFPKAKLAISRIHKKFYAIKFMGLGLKSLLEVNPLSTLCSIYT